MLPLTALAGEAVSCHDIENYLCEQAGISPDQLAFHDVFTYLVQPPQCLWFAPRSSWPARA